ncbi:MAG: hypothetical protein FWF47_07760, partial [Clostridia bacterium]|nr:hypothetical protein [Clostridia bacterium]
MIGAAEVREASEEMRRYKAGKALLEERIIENERWYRLKNDVIKRSGGEERSRSAWLINSVMSKHADAMDNYPEAMVLPREEGDRADAVVLSSVLPVVMEQNEYEQTYSDIWWYKLKQGTGVHGVFWNAAKENGLGDVEVRKIDLLNLYWEPGITDIQESKYLFHAALWDGDTLKEKYPKQTKNLTPANTGELAGYAHENTDGWGDKEKALVIDWYYKKNGKLHLCKYTQDVVLYATENDTALKESGLYRHGLYPFVFDTLIPAEGTPAGYGLIDIMRNPQETIDKLDTLILNNAAFNAQPRYFISDQAGVNEGEFADMRKEFVHVTGAINPLHLQPITGKDLGGEVYAMRQYKIDELKETTGNRDVSNGGSQPGVTAA